MSPVMANLLAALGGLGFALLMLAASWGVAGWIAATGSSPAWLLGVFLGLPALLVLTLALTERFWGPVRRRGAAAIC